MRSFTFFFFKKITVFSVTSLLEYCLGITDVLLCLMHSSSSLVLMTSALSIVSLFIKILFAASFDSLLSYVRH